MFQSKESIFSDVMIVTDFDGTLRGNNSAVPENNITAIKRFTEFGGTFIVASGRAGFVLDVAEPRVKDIVNAPCVYSNGSYFYDYKTGERSHEKFVAEKIVREIMYTTREIDSEAGIRIVRGDEYLTPDENEEIKRQIAKGYMQNVRVYDYETLPVDKINKLTVCSTEDAILRIKKIIEEKYSKFVDVYLCAKALIDIQPKNVSKGSAIEQIRADYINKGIKKKIYAVGDYENDIDMLKVADFSCCPSNSLQEVIDFCDVHLCSNDEGCIADLIHRIEKGLA